MNNLCFLNGSPKANNKSNSDFFINEFSKSLNDNINVTKYYATKAVKDECLIEDILNNDTIIIVSPLYADTYPSNMLKLLSLLEAHLKNSSKKTINVYGIINCGFYEGSQCRHALDMLKYFCRRSGITWKFGITIGGGECLSHLSDLKTSIHAESLCKAFETLAQAINTSNCTQTENIFTSPDKMNGFIYRLVANSGWCYSVFKSKDIPIYKLFQKIY